MCVLKKYDVFISYRRKNRSEKTEGTDIARSIAKELQLRKYKVFFDYSNCTDNEFEILILSAIRESKYFLLVLTKEALDRCCDDGDWVRREIKEAIDNNCKIIPVNPDNRFQQYPKDLPSEIATITKIQNSEISMGSLFEKSIDKLIEDRFNSNSFQKAILYFCTGLFCFLLVLFSIYGIRTMISNRNNRLSEELTFSIEHNEYDQLKEFAYLDSSRAFGPYAFLSYQRILENDSSQKNFDEVRLFAQKAVDFCSSDSVSLWLLEITSGQIIIKDFLSEEKSSSAQPKFAPNDKQKESDDNLFNKAIKNNDWTTLEKLANKGYVLAYIPLANHYLKDYRTHNKAYYYAVKAKKSGLKGADAILDTLELYDY